MEIQYWQAGAGAAKAAGRFGATSPQNVPLITPEAAKALEQAATQ